MRVLYERYACFRPLRRVSRLAEQGLPMAPGTMAGAMKSLAPMFAPLASAILDHHNDMTVRHGGNQLAHPVSRPPARGLDVELGQRRLCLLPQPVTQRRGRGCSAPPGSPSSLSATAQAYSFDELAVKVILCLCWTHANRVIEAAAGQEGRKTCTTWLARIAVIFQVNTVRLMHYPRTGTPDIDVRRTARRPCGGCRGLFQVTERDALRKARRSESAA